MRIICPNNPKHSRFYTTVVTDITVDSWGVLTKDPTVQGKPDPYNDFICCECDALARVEKLINPPTT